MKKVTLLTAFMLLAIQFGIKANNIQIANVSLSGQNTASNYTSVNFDISWDNSWRTSTNESNYDGAWLFVKWRKKGTSEWRHATINYVAPGDATSCGHTASSGAMIQTSSDTRGVWIHRDSDGIGNISFAANSLRWNYGADGVLDNDSVDINVYAIEMVYIPQGQFTLGSGSSTDYNGFSTYGASSVAANEYLVTSNAAITVGATAGSLYYTNNGVGYPTYFLGGGDNAGPIPAAYPKGYDAFWIMKYECSQQQYTDFLNSLDNVKATNRLTLMTGAHPSFVAPNPERAMYATSIVDLLAYADWAGMRPFSELEYEKACRGANIAPVGNEYAWGNTSFTNISGTTNAGMANETVSAGNVVSNANTPFRCGLLATSSSNRVSSGATYYGVMEMAGNVYERPVTVANAASRAFTSTVHGNGFLATNGSTDIAVWNAMNLAYKGAAFNTITAQYFQTSDRVSAAGEVGTTTARPASNGIRLARTAE
jgi:formylglycine-generating enzyme required for sulfatase activity